ncbi:MAG: (2Fe-2S) ferredoxin domain-containing protein [Deltaproteobacteria bacterium]|nr:(2Fe-2S) ferredoxin domain-containing protein [Deltaproteobacteria bacterium]MBW2128089.1 (2Fe-2S) ferredoxin domain-containing protein [Deltaproteobacteria bacterium]MBW2303000.1 (2Fe-2S) ferredoxin domain-containing protein [Deltaproteobacteria bacterium]
MAKLTIEDLKRIKEQVKKDTALREGGATVKITVHMGTCGIAAGAREVMDALLQEMAETDRQDIRVVTSGCMGMCSSEPNVTVEVQGHDPVVYQGMDANKMRQVFKRHVLLGEVQTDFALARMKEESPEEGSAEQET